MRARRLFSVGQNMRAPNSDVMRLLGVLRRVDRQGCGQVPHAREVLAVFGLRTSKSRHHAALILCRPQCPHPRPSPSNPLFAHSGAKQAMQEGVFMQSACICRAMPEQRCQYSRARRRALLMCACVCALVARHGCAHTLRCTHRRTSRLRIASLLWMLNPNSQMTWDSWCQTLSDTRRSLAE